MGRFLFILAVLAFVATLGATPASAGTSGDGGHSFAWFRDADGDGIPNGLDPDWLRPEDGSGYKVKNRFGTFLGVAFGGFGGSTGSAEYRYRHQHNRPDAPGDCLRVRERLQDGSCR